MMKVGRVGQYYNTLRDGLHIRVRPPPRRVSELYFFMALYKNMLFVWNRVGQGSKRGPQGWGRVSALISRLAQPLF